MSPLVCIAESPMKAPRQAGSRCGVLSPMRLWEIEKSVCAYGSFCGFPVHYDIRIDAFFFSLVYFFGADGVSYPSERKSGCLSYAHDVPSSGNGTAECMYSSGGVYFNIIRMSENHAACAYRSECASVRHNTFSNSRRSIVLPLLRLRVFPRQERIFSAASLVRYPVISVDSYTFPRSFLSIPSFSRTSSDHFLAGTSRSCIPLAFRHFRCVFSRESKSDIILWKQDVGAFCVNLRLVLLHPHDF